MKVLICFIIPLCIFGTEIKNDFILLQDNLIDNRVQKKIFDIGTEVKNKLGINIYMYITKDNGIDNSLSMNDKIKLTKKFNDKIISQRKLSTNYAILIISINQQYANLLTSNNLKDVLDKNDILNGYVIPLLASKDKNSLFAKTSAASLNGYAQIADSLAKKQNIQLVSSIGSSGKVASSIWRVLIYTIVLFGIVAYIIIAARSKKIK